MDNIGSNYSYRDNWQQTLANSGTGATEETTGTGQNWNAVFTDKKNGAVSVDDFLTLMVAQLKNQDFMNPVDDTQYVTQLAQFATMQQMQEMGANMKSNYVLSLVGKNITAAKFSVSGSLIKETGVVQKISLVNNEYSVTVNGKTFTLEQIMEINNSGSAGGGSDSAVDDAAKKNYLNSLLGKTVTLKEKDEEGFINEVTGWVSKVSSEGGKFTVFVNGSWYSLDSVVRVEGEEEPDKDEDEDKVEGPDETPDTPDTPDDTEKPDETGGTGTGGETGGTETGGETGGTGTETPTV